MESRAIGRLQGVSDNPQRSPEAITYAAERSGQPVERLLRLAVPAVVFSVVGLLTFANTSDDPLITLRYASNVLHHGQATFNLGEHVEGYSSPLHLLLAMVVLLLPGGLELLKLKLLSMLFAAAAVWQTGRLARACGLPRWAELATLVGVAGSWNFMVSASNGLETSLVAFLATGTAVSLAGDQDWRHTAGWAALLAVTRPDAVLVVALLGAVSVARGCSSRWWCGVRWLSGPAVTLGALETFRVAYYGALVPNTYFAKDMGALRSLGKGLVYLVISQPLGGTGLGLAVIVLEGWLIWVGARRFLPFRRALAYPMAVVVAQVIFVLSSGGDWMKGGRFLVPAIPAMTVLVFAGFEAILAAPGSKVERSRAARGVATITLIAALVAPGVSGQFAPAWRLASGLGDHALIADGNYPDSPIWARAVSLARCLRAGQTVAWSEVGLFGYEHLDLNVIDTRGLTDSEIAHQAPAQLKEPWGVEDRRWYRPDSSVGRILLRRKPDMIISFDDTPVDWPGAEIFDGLYRRVARIPERKSGNILLAYARRGLACSGSRPATSSSSSSSFSSSS